jgi:hypothetical protein
LYQRKVKALEAITLDDVLPLVESDPVLSTLDRATVRDLFTGRKAQEIESLTRTLDGKRDDSHREGHDRCYVTVADGVKVNLDCKKVDGKMVPVLHDGLPVAESIMLHYLELSSVTVTEGVRKEVNSGASVRMKNCIDRLLNKRSVGLKTFSLKADNFESVTVNREAITREDLLKESQGELLADLFD